MAAVGKYGEGGISELASAASQMRATTFLLFLDAQNESIIDLISFV